MKPTLKKNWIFPWRGMAGGALWLLGAALAPATIHAQESAVIHACYVPSSGTVYRVREPGLRDACGTSEKDGQTESHVAFSWISATAVSPEAAGGNGGGKSIDHGTLLGLSDDDHPQYLPVNGVRTATSGFAMTGTVGAASPLSTVSTGWEQKPALLWHAGKGAFRAGGVGEFTGLGNALAWNDDKVGAYSIGLGASAVASGDYSFAAGVSAGADGEGSVALGRAARSPGTFATALGPAANASGFMAISLGGEASGTTSIAIGQGANTNEKTGAIVISPGMVNQSEAFAQANDQVVIRGSSLWIGNNSNVTAPAGRLIQTSTGAYLSSGGAWVSVSDATRKTAFADVNGDEILAKVEAMPIRTWSYKDEDARVRHLGPTAQDFHAAFGLGDTATAIAGVDADGVSLAAIQALAKRIRELEATVAALQASQQH